MGQFLSFKTGRSVPDVPVFAAHAGDTAILMFNSPRYGEAIGSYRGDALYHASLDASEYVDLLSASGFGVVEHIVEDPKAGGRTVWLARRSAPIQG
jgi:hypothetical protein